MPEGGLFTGTLIKECDGLVDNYKMAGHLSGSKATLCKTLRLTRKEVGVYPGMAFTWEFRVSVVTRDWTTILLNYKYSIHA